LELLDVLDLITPGSSALPKSLQQIAPDQVSKARFYRRPWRADQLLSFASSNAFSSAASSILLSILSPDIRF